VRIVGCGFSEHWGGIVERFRVLGGESRGGHWRS